MKDKSIILMMILIIVVLSVIGLFRHKDKIFNNNKKVVVEQVNEDSLSLIKK
jgi:hypothetical protein